MSLGDLIDFCARCVALGIAEGTRLRAVADAEGSLVAISTASRLAPLLDVVKPVGASYGTIIEGGVIIDIPRD